MRLFLLICLASTLIITNKSMSYDIQRHLPTTKLVSQAISQYHPGKISLITNRKRLGKKTLLCSRPNMYLSLIILVIAGDVETNPGPAVKYKYPCRLCDKPVRSNQAGVACDKCDKWFHKKCMGMNSAIYSSLRNISWECIFSGFPNFSSSLFEEDNYQTSQNRFDMSSSRECSLPSFDSKTTMPSPVAKSSPLPRKQASAKLTRPLKLLNINLQSINNKKAEFLNLVDTHKPDIIVGTESWLKPAVKSAEIFPPWFSVYRKDRKDGYGGVFLAVKNDLISEEITDIEKNDKLEVTCVKISLAKD